MLEVMGAQLQQPPTLAIARMPAAYIRTTSLVAHNHDRRRRAQPPRSRVCAGSADAPLLGKRSDDQNALTAP
jgi:hypothetical protein